MLREERLGSERRRRVHDRGEKRRADPAPSPLGVNAQLEEGRARPVDVERREPALGEPVPPRVRLGLVPVEADPVVDSGHGQRGVIFVRARALDLRDRPQRGVGRGARVHLLDAHAAAAA
jgi:hypothetical protein